MVVTHVDWMCPWCTKQYTTGGNIHRDTWVRCWNCGRTMPLRKVALALYGNGESIHQFPHPYYWQLGQTSLQTVN